MGDLHRMRDVRAFEHFDRNGLFPPGGRGVGHVRAELDEKQTRLPGLWPPIGNFGEPPNLLEHFHYSHFRSHNIHSRENDRRSRAIESAVQRKRQELRCWAYLAVKMHLRVQPRCFLNLRQVAAMSSELRMAETTQTRCAPAARTSAMLLKFMPPIANQGIITFAAAHRTYSNVTGVAPGFVPVAYTGPMAM